MQTAATPPRRRRCARQSGAPHRGLGQQAPIPYARSTMCGPIRRQDMLGGLIHEYDREAA